MINAITEMQAKSPGSRCESQDGLAATGRISRAGMRAGRSGIGAELPVLRAKEGDAPVKPYRNRPKTPRLGEMCPRRGGRASGVACAIVVRQGQGDHPIVRKGQPAGP